MFTVSFCPNFSSSSLLLLLNFIFILLIGYHDLPVEELRQPSWVAKHRDAHEKHIEELCCGRQRLSVP